MFGEETVTRINNVSVLGYNSEDNTFLCPYCCNRFSYDRGTVDHVIPKSVFSRWINNLAYRVNDWRNKLLCCGTCNVKKGFTIYIPLADKSPLRTMPDKWQIEYAEYFKQCFESISVSSGYPWYFAQSNVSRGAWDRFMERYKERRTS